MPSSRSVFVLGVLASASLSACDPVVARPDAGDGGADTAELPDAAPPVDPMPLMHFDADAAFDAPFPSDHLRKADGTIDLSRLPPATRNSVVRQLRAAASTLQGFGATSAIHLSFTTPLDAARLPSGILRSSTAPVQLINIEAGPHFGERAPIELYFAADGGPFGHTNVLTALPVQGIPLRGGERYALVVMRGLTATDGRVIERAPEMDAIARGETVPGLGEASARYLAAYGALASLDVNAADVLAMTVFTPQDPTERMQRAVETTTTRIEPTGLEPREVYSDYCAFHATAQVPVFQEGTPPYARTGGAWVWDESDHLVLDHFETANVWITVPRTPMPTAGFPLVLLVRTGAGADNALVDRGPHAIAGGVAVPGTGPATQYAQAGWAGVQFDGPHGGMRNITAADEQFLVFNIQNATALRDNLRQSALELVLFARSLDTLRVDATTCPGLAASDVRFDLDHVALMGHSMGASIAPIAMAFEPRFEAMIVSGAGASWIENIIYKESPLPTRPIAEALLGYTGRRLREDDPVLSLLQWSDEEADAAVYAPIFSRDATSPRNVLVFQGVRDTYIPPEVANPLTLALGIDVVSPVIEPSVIDALSLTARQQIPFPASLNLRGATAALVQHEEDGIEDGHEILWQRADARMQMGCFLRTLRDEGAVIANATALPAACTR